jgi:hypothetical protein
MMASCHEPLAKRSAPQPWLIAVHGAAAIGDSGRSRNPQLSREKNLFQKRVISISCSIFIIIFA